VGKGGHCGGRGSCMGRCGGDLGIWSRAGRGWWSYRDGRGVDYGFLRGYGILIADYSFRGYGISIAHYGVVRNYSILVGNDSITIAHYGVVWNYGIVIAHYGIIRNYSILVGNDGIAIARYCAV
jgi:hypothetical protein